MIQTPLPSLLEQLRQLPQHLSQLFRPARKRGVRRLDILHSPLHAAIFHEHVLKEWRQSLVLHASDERKLAREFGFRPGRRRSMGIERAHGTRPEEIRQMVRFAVVKVVEQDVPGAFDRALVSGGLDSTRYSQFADIWERILSETGDGHLVRIKIWCMLATQNFQKA